MPGTNQVHPENAVPCRTCTDFKTWTKQVKRKNAPSISSDLTDQKTVQLEEDRRKRCPYDKDDLGRSTWGLLHTIAAHYPNKPTTEQSTSVTSFFKALSKVYPCDFCAKDLQEELKVDPPDVSSQSNMAQWLCRLHNRVNVKVGKPVFDCSKVNERWKDGWKDGSCD